MEQHNQESVLGGIWCYIVVKQPEMIWNQQEHYFLLKIIKELITERTKTSNPPKTGDMANAALWIAILVLSAAGITGVRIWNKKKQVKRLGIEEKKEEKE